MCRFFPFISFSVSVCCLCNVCDARGAIININLQMKLSVQMQTQSEKNCCVPDVECFDEKKMKKVQHKKVNVKRTKMMNRTSFRDKYTFCMQHNEQNQWQQIAEEKTCFFHHIIIFQAIFFSFYSILDENFSLVASSDIYIDLCCGSCFYFLSTLFVVGATFQVCIFFEKRNPISFILRIFSFVFFSVCETQK